MDLYHYQNTGGMSAPAPLPSHMFGPSGLHPLAPGPQHPGLIPHSSCNLMQVRTLYSW